VLDVQARVSAEEPGERGAGVGPRRWRSSSRRNRPTSSCPILSKKSK
jgi:hypothetical protein